MINAQDLSVEVAFFDHDQDHPFSRLISHFYSHHVLAISNTVLHIVTQASAPSGKYSMLLLQEDHSLPGGQLLHICPTVIIWKKGDLLEVQLVVFNMKWVEAIGPVTRIVAQFDHSFKNLVEAAEVFHV